jgi:hypothetical protein
MNHALCAYCRQKKFLTLEHLWPKAIHRRLVAANQWKNPVAWLARLQQNIQSEPQIRDVCEHCNNVVLSKLDDYACSLFDNAFSHMPERDEEVIFEYDYHLLKRWLLKVSFNSARINNSVDLKALNILIHYMLGSDNFLGRSVQLFVQLVHPEEIPEGEIPPNAPQERPLIFWPEMNRSGHFFFRVHGIGEKLMRAIHVRSYLFTLAYFRPGDGRSVQEDFAQIYTKKTSTVLLRPSEQKIKIVCNGIGAWSSIKGSRANRIEFQRSL